MSYSLIMGKRKTYDPMVEKFIYGIGFLAQLLFSARAIVQWIKSEKVGRVLSPLLFWQISLFASITMLIYGILRSDFAIILGQFIAYFIYIRNIQLHNAWRKIPFYLRIIIPIMPFLSVAFMFFTGNMSFNSILSNNNVVIWLKILGVSAHLLFYFRFIYQWLHSERIKESVLPKGFWFISMGGSTLIIIYGIFRHDPVLIIGHAVSFVVYIRNILIAYTGKSIFNFIPKWFIEKMK